MGLGCAIKGHDWKEAVLYNWESNVKDIEPTCLRCGKKEKKTVPVK